MQPLLGYEARFVAGFFITLGVAAIALLLAVLLGLAGAAAKLSAGKVTQRVAGTYTTVVRGIPELLFILVVYYDLQRLINFAYAQLGNDGGFIIPPFWAGALGIGIFYGAYMTETFRGAMLAVPRGQREAALSLGLPPQLLFWRIIFPQMLRHALPGIRNNWLVLLKATALVSVIGLSDDMMAVANQAKAKTREPFLFYFAASIGYLLLTAASGTIFNFLEKRARRGLDDA
ncbi:ABC transporter permease subunit [Candidatus Persebacteraceae bacterium Df01]|jgi:arginine/ornithine transport system permease protein|uniref:ABC transporter permease subunit n=1 Tax=Candidatus Doriopsillibacter californiensis TaxID=2970740 RepID=A0ABT7QND2_9GAMM|nr:ABC transporter permease subunit [Candidatus Persebacteraceae bacterium Df01]